jgi:hypothetical protein
VLARIATSHGRYQVCHSGIYQGKMLCDSGALCRVRLGEEQRQGIQYEKDCHTVKTVRSLGRCCCFRPARRLLVPYLDFHGSEQQPVETLEIRDCTHGPTTTTSRQLLHRFSIRRKLDWRRKLSKKIFLAQNVTPTLTREYMKRHIHVACQCFMLACILFHVWSHRQALKT